MAISNATDLLSRPKHHAKRFFMNAELHGQRNRNNSKPTIAKKNKADPSIAQTGSRRCNELRYNTEWSSDQQVRRTCICCVHISSVHSNPILLEVRRPKRGMQLTAILQDRRNGAAVTVGAVRG